MQSTLLSYTFDLVTYARVAVVLGTPQHVLVLVVVGMAVALPLVVVVTAVVGEGLPKRNLHALVSGNGRAHGRPPHGPAYALARVAGVS